MEDQDKKRVGITVEEAAKIAAEESGENTEQTSGKAAGYCEKCQKLIGPVTEKVRDLVLGFGEIIITVTVVIALISAFVGGLSAMGNVGFFAGLSYMFTEMANVIMGALVLFLLFGIYRNTEKK